MLIARALRVALGRRTVLDGIDLDAPPGAVTAIAGPNGSGKTTLLRVLTGELPSAGEIWLNGRAVARLRPWELAACRAVLPQATPLAFPFTVAEVVGLGHTAGTAAGDHAVAAAALAAVGLRGHAGRLYQELSGGEQQRVQLARVLAQVWEPSGPGGPRWLFLDEPVAGLDIAHQLQVMELARDYARRGGGVVAVMHDLNLTAAFADRVLLLDAGRIAAAGPPARALDGAVLSRVYRCRVRVGALPQGGVPFVLPQCCAPG